MSPGCYDKSHPNDLISTYQTELQLYLYISTTVQPHQLFVSIEVSIPACHAGDPGSIPGRRDLFVLFLPQWQFCHSFSAQG